jgi:hypothetical protein
VTSTNAGRNAALSLLFVVAAAFLGAWPIELCWNYLVSTGVIPWRTVTFWQAWCALYVARSLFSTSVANYGKG